MGDLSSAIAQVEIVAAAYRPDKKDMIKLIENAPSILRQSFAPRVRNSEFYNLRYGEYVAGGDKNDVFNLVGDGSKLSGLRIGCAEHRVRI